MEDFRTGLADVLISTTVIEVGVDVPNATVMLIENAERFGLAQLHQLRGRIGRGAHTSFCVLFDESDEANLDARARIEAMTRTVDGFELADEDLRLRGEGTLFDTRQSGMPDLKLARLADDLDLVKRARARAFELIDAIPTSRTIRASSTSSASGSRTRSTGSSARDLRRVRSTARPRHPYPRNRCGSSRAARRGHGWVARRRAFGPSPIGSVRVSSPASSRGSGVRACWIFTPGRARSASRRCPGARSTRRSSTAPRRRSRPCGTTCGAQPSRTGGAVQRSDVRRFLERAQEHASGFDLVFLDPPYDAVPPSSIRSWPLSDADHLLREGFTVVLSRGSRSSNGVIPLHWAIARRLSYGDSVVTLFRSRSLPGTPGNMEV